MDDIRRRIRNWVRRKVFSGLPEIQRLDTSPLEQETARLRAALNELAVSTRNVERRLSQRRKTDRLRGNG